MNISTNDKKILDDLFKKKKRTKGLQRTIGFSITKRYGDTTIKALNDMALGYSSKFVFEEVEYKVTGWVLIQNGTVCTEDVKNRFGGSFFKKGWSYQWLNPGWTHISEYPEGFFDHVNNVVKDEIVDKLACFRDEEISEQLNVIKEISDFYESRDLV